MLGPAELQGLLFPLDPRGKPEDDERKVVFGGTSNDKNMV